MIVLSNVSGLRNRGVEANLRSALEGFARHLPEKPTKVLTQGMMEDLLGTNVTAEGLHIPLAQFLAPDGLKNEIGALLTNRDDIRRRLTEASSAAKRLAEANFSAVREALGVRVRVAA